MRRFKFRLQTPLDLRHRVEQAALQALARALRRLEASERGVADLEAEREAALRELATTEGDSIDPRRLAMGFDTVGAMERSLEAARDAVLAAQRGVDAARVAVRARAAERKALERLRDRARDDHEEEVKRKEAQELDELASGRFLRMREEPR